MIPLEIEIQTAQNTLQNYSYVEDVLRYEKNVDQTCMIDEFLEKNVRFNLGHYNGKNFNDKVDADDSDITILGSYTEIDDVIHTNNSRRLTAAFLIESERYLQKNNITPTQNVVNAFGDLSSFLSILPFENFAIEIEMKSIKITLTFGKNRILMINKLVEDNFDGLYNKDIVYSYFINRQLISSDVTNLETFAKKFKEYIFDSDFEVAREIPISTYYHS